MAMTLSQENLKQALKEALVETLHEQRDWFQGILLEAIEDIALAEAMKEGLESEDASEEEITIIFDVARRGD